VTRLPNLDDLDLNYGDDDPKDVEDILRGADDLAAVRAADEALINLSGRDTPYVPPVRCQHFFPDGRQCTYTTAMCRGHKEKSSREFIFGESNV
jgi:hypothetical protein